MRLNQSPRGATEQRSGLETKNCLRTESYGRTLPCAAAAGEDRAAIGRTQLSDALNKLADNVSVTADDMEAAVRRANNLVRAVLTMLHSHNCAAVPPRSLICSV